VIKKTASAFFPLVVFLLYSTAFAGSIGLVTPQLPSDIQTLVDRTIPSKPGDLFVVLKNGLTVLLHQHGGHKTLSAQVFVRAGSVYEDRYQNAGLSHYLEHVVSGGSTSSFSEMQGKERINRMGGETNASTSYDRTTYYINTSAGQWKDALDLLLSYVSECTLDVNEVEREKAIIQQEMKMGENNPGSELWKLFMRTAYVTSPVRSPVIGYEEVFVSRTRDDLLDYYASRYQPQNMVLAVAGEIDPIEILRFTAERTKGFLRKVERPVVLPDEPLQSSPRWSEKTLSVARLTKVIMGFPSVRLNEKDLYALDVLAFILGEGKTSRLHRRIKELDNRVLTVSASNWTPSFVRGQFIISLTLPAENWPGVMTSIAEEIDRLKKERVTAKELGKAKKSAIAAHLFEKEKESAVAASLGSCFLDTGDPYFDDKYVEEMRRVTPEAVREAARHYLVMDRLNVAVVRPPESREARSTEETSTTRDYSAELSPIDYHRLNNGLKVLIRRDPSIPIVTVQLYGLGGLLLEDSQHPGISAFTTSLLLSGTKTRGKLEIAGTIENIGGTIESRSENNTYHVSIKVLKEDLHTALNLLSEIVRSSRFPENEIEKKRKETLLAIRQLDESWQHEVLHLFKQRYFHESPYGRNVLGTAESVSALSRSDLLTFYKRMINPRNSVLAVYGDIEPKQAMEAISRDFGPWAAPTAVEPELSPGVQSLTWDETIEKKNEKTSAALFIGTKGIGIESPERPVLDVLSTILSGGLNPCGRLFGALRGGSDDLVYLVGAFPFYGWKTGYFGIITQTTMANIDKVRDIILDILGQLADKPATPEELQAAKDMLLTSRRLALTTLESQARGAAVNEVMGLGWNYDREYPALIGAVTAEQVQQLAKDLFSHTLIVRTVPEHPKEILAPAASASPTSE
jgi:zinc protease